MATVTTMLEPDPAVGYIRKNADEKALKDFARKSRFYITDLYVERSPRVALTGPGR